MGPWDPVGPGIRLRATITHMSPLHPCALFPSWAAPSASRSPRPLTGSTGTQCLPQQPPSVGIFFSVPVPKPLGETVIGSSAHSRIHKWGPQGQGCAVYMLAQMRSEVGGGEIPGNGAGACEPLVTTAVRRAARHPRAPSQPHTRVILACVQVNLYTPVTVPPQGQAQNQVQEFGAFGPLGSGRKERPCEGRECPQRPAPWARARGVTGKPR